MAEVDLTFHRIIKVAPALLSVLPAARLSSIIDAAAVEHRQKVADQLTPRGGLAACYHGRQIPTVHDVMVAGVERRFVLVSQIVRMAQEDAGRIWWKTRATTQEDYVRDILGLTQ